MFSNHWIVADMDGTLTPTPSRAHGKYLSLSHCMSTGLGYGARYRSCLPWLRLFLEGGGSLCVVSTAGKRMWMQLYQDLAPAVFGLTSFSTLDEFGAMTESATASASSATAKGSPSQSMAGTMPGALYMCGFTGAALFRTRPCPVVWADMDRLHPGWRQTPDTTSSCSSTNTTSSTSFTIPPAAVGIEEWAAYRQQAVKWVGHSAKIAVNAAAVADIAQPSSSTTTMDTTAYTLAVEEGRSAIIRFFEHASYVSGHDVTAGAAFFAACLSSKYHKVYTEILQKLLDEAKTELHFAERQSGTVPKICFASSKVLSPRALATYGLFLKETNDALVDAQQVPYADGTIADGSPVAQVTVMGIPMRYFDAIFPSSSSTTPTNEDSSCAATSSTALQWQCCAKCAAVGAGAKTRLEAAGLELKSQPNSVCLHRRGVDKGLCVRWLISQGQKKKRNESSRETALSFELTKTLSFGDVPESVDRPLTEYPPMQFISLSPKDGAAEKLAAVQSANTSRVSPYLYHVGGEEEGTALFLEELLTSCVKEASEKAESNAQGEKTWFTCERVSTCAARAHASVKALQTDRRCTEGSRESSRSTL